LRGPNADARTPVILQTFSEASAKTLSAIKIGVPVVLLLSDGDAWDSPAQVKSWQPFVQGLGPSKTILETNPRLVEWAHAAGMTVVPYTFRSSNSGRYPSVRAEMKHFLYSLGVDGLFTDNPDQFPRR
jgi:glycerophosphoryl diester phosphodiesterase